MAHTTVRRNAGGAIAGTVTALKCSRAGPGRVLTHKDRDTAPRHLQQRWDQDMFTGCKRFSLRFPGQNFCKCAWLDANKRGPLSSFWPTNAHRCNVYGGIARSHTGRLHLDLGTINMPDEIFM